MVRTASDVEFACRTALSYRGVAHISIPVDFKRKRSRRRATGAASENVANHTSDVLALAGSSFPYIEFIAKPGQARGLQIDLDPVRIGLRYPVEVGLVGDCRRALQKLLPLLKNNRKRSFLEEAQVGMRDWKRLMKSRSRRPPSPCPAKSQRSRRCAWPKLGPRHDGRQEDHADDFRG